MVHKSVAEKINILVLLFCLVALVAVEIIAVNEYQVNRDHEIFALREQGRRLISTFDHELKVQEVTLEMLAAEAQSILVGDERPVRGTVVDLAPTENLQGYSLGVIRTKTEEQIGNLTGLGNIPAIRSPVSDEIGMALGLTPLFEQIIRNNNSLPWVYYTSVSRFVYMYPRVPADQFFYSDRLLEKEYFTIATPEQDPQRQAVWSTLYDDEAGAGLMVTISKPIYDKHKFLGVLSIDMSLSNLLWLLDSPGMHNATAYLVGPDGEKMTGLGDKEIAIDVDAVQPETLTQIGDLTVMVFPLRETNWYLVFDIDTTSLSLSAVKATSHLGLLFGFVLFSVLVVLVISHYMRAARFMAINDTLTGVLNRRAFDEFSFSTVQKKAPADALFGLAIIDIDFFKKYNDFYGHLAGDDALRRVANALKNSLRSPADAIFRIGGEEFAVMVKLEKAEDMPPILERLVNGVSDLGIPHARSPFQQVTVSVGGMIVHPASVSTLDEVYKRADDALFEAKDTGRNRWLIDASTISLGIVLAAFGQFV